MAAPLPMEEFCKMLRAFMSPIDAHRNAAEQAYKGALAANPSSLLVTLVETLHTQPDAAVRSMAAVMLRQLVMSHWTKTPDAVQKPVQDKLMACFAKEPEALLRRRLCHVIAQVCSTVPDTDTAGATSWARQVFPVAVAACGDADAGRRASGIFLAAKTMEFSPEVIIKEQARPLQEAFCRLLADADATVRVHAVKTAATFLVRLDSKEFRAAIGPLNLVQTFLGLFGAFLSAGDEERARAVFEEVLNVARITPTSFKPHLDAVVKAVQSVATSTGLDTDTRKQSLELMLTLAEAAPGMARKQPAFVHAAVELCMNLMVLADEDAAWEAQEYNPEGDTDPKDPGDGDECAAVGSEGLMRLAHILRGDAVMPVFLAVLPKLTATGTWQAKRAVLTAVGLVANGCRKQMKPHLDAMVGMVVALTKDPHQRVRHAAAGAAGMMASGFASNKGSFSTKYGAQMLGALAAVLKDTGNCPRTRTHAATAVINFTAPEDVDVDETNNFPASAIAPCLPVLVEGLVAALSIPSRLSQRQVLFAVSAVAGVAQGSFGDFFDGFVGGLKGILARPVATDGDRLVLAAAMRCLARLGSTVSRGRFLGPGRAAMDGIIGMHRGGQLPPDEPFAIEILKAATEICKHLGDACTAYLPVIMPPLFKSAQRKVDISHENVEEEARAAPSGNLSSVVVEVKGYGHLRLNFDTVAAGERRAALAMLYQFARELGASFLPYVEATYGAVQPSLNHPHLHNCRETATAMVPELVRTLVDHGPDQPSALAAARALTADALKHVTAAMLTERSEDVRVAQVECVKDLMHIAACTPDDPDSAAPPTTPPPPMALPLADADRLLKALQTVAVASVMRRQATMQELDDKEDADDLERAAVLEDLSTERELMADFVDACGYLIKAHRAAFLPLYEAHLKPLTGFADVKFLEADEFLFHNAVCMLIDVVEWCGPAGLAAALGPLMPALVAGVADADADPMVQQACLYGLGVVARVAGRALTPQLPALLRRLHALITAPDARDADNVDATENAVSTLAKFVVYLEAAALPNRAELLALWVSALPLREDEEEAQWNHKLLCDFVEKRDPAVMPHLPRAMAVFAEVLVGAGGGGGSDDSVDMVDGDTLPRIVALVKANAAVLDAAGLSEPQRAAVQAAIKG